MRDVSGRERTLLAGAAAALIVFIYVFALAMPQRTDTAAVVQEQEALSAKIAAADNMYRDVPAVTDEIAELSSTAGELLFFDEDVPAAVVRELDGLASEFELVMASVSPEEAEIVGELIKYPTLFKVEAGFGSLVRLLYELEQPGRRLRVEEVTMGSVRAGGKLGADIRVAAYAPAPESEETDAQD
jgi:hypothetical protein